MLHISATEQKKRLLARLDDPEKYWKFSPGDVDERAHWAEYQRAYEIALERTNTEVAPWHVIPADRKWFARAAAAAVIASTLIELDPRFPLADDDTRREMLELRAELEAEGRDR